MELHIYAAGRIFVPRLARGLNTRMSTVPLPSRQWSCSELAEGAKLVADMPGMELRIDANSLSREQLLESIKDPWVGEALYCTQQPPKPYKSYKSFNNIT